MRTLVFLLSGVIVLHVNLIAQSCDEFPSRSPIKEQVESPSAAPDVAILLVYGPGIEKCQAGMTGKGTFKTPVPSVDIAMSEDDLCIKLGRDVECGARTEMFISALGANNNLGHFSVVPNDITNAFFKLSLSISHDFFIERVKQHETTTALGSMTVTVQNGVLTINQIGKFTTNKKVGKGKEQVVDIGMLPFKHADSFVLFQTAARSTIDYKVSFFANVTSATGKKPVTHFSFKTKGKHELDCFEVSEPF